MSSGMKTGSLLMPKIVVVEDQQVLATVYRNKFIAEGFQVEVATDGEAGIILINSAKPDLVILDVMLPKLNGIEVLKKVRANPSFRTLPVLIFSNTSLPGMVEEAWNAGATMVLSKLSHSPKQIVESVRTALKAAGENQPSAALVEANSSATPPVEAPASSQRRSTPGRLLLIEDHPDVRALISFLADQAGHEVTSAESHAGALRKARLQEFDLFLVSRVCPDGPGVTLCRQLRQTFPRKPIVMYPTDALPSEQKAGLDAGARSYLTKASDLINIGDLVFELIKESKEIGNDALPARRAVSPLAA
jgi:two-component system, response regulator